LLLGEHANLAEECALRGIQSRRCVWVDSAKIIARPLRGVRWRCIRRRTQRLAVGGGDDRSVGRPRHDFGPVLSIFFRDPDGLECEVCFTNPDVSGSERPIPPHAVRIA
jgi:catechol 2,3-dioxygenase-like lactoylglutathione lyase family enzyme